MINGCVQIGLFQDTLKLCNDMQVAGIRPNHVAIVGVLSTFVSLMLWIRVDGCMHI